MAGLHGYERIRCGEDQWANIDNTEDEPALTELCTAIVQAHASPASYEQWRKWLYESELKTLPDSGGHSGLGRVRRAMDAFAAATAGEGATPQSLAARLRPNAKAPELKSCQTWLLGAFLEEYCQICFKELQRDLPISSSDRNLLYRAKQEISDSFELDAIAMSGYQLFAVSCITSDKKAPCKEHFLEVFVRARQLGGDEARVGLVCCHDRPDLLEKELARNWDSTGKVRVFGRWHLKSLADHFYAWIKTAND